MKTGNKIKCIPLLQENKEDDSYAICRYDGVNLGGVYLVIYPHIKERWRAASPYNDHEPEFDGFQKAVKWLRLCGPPFPLNGCAHDSWKGEEYSEDFHNLRVRKML